MKGKKLQHLFKLFLMKRLTRPLFRKKSEIFETCGSLFLSQLQCSNRKQSNCSIWNIAVMIFDIHGPSFRGLWSKLKKIH